MLNHTYTTGLSFGKMFNKCVRASSAFIAHLPHRFVENPAFWGPKTRAGRHTKDKSGQQHESHNETENVKEKDPRQGHKKAKKLLRAAAARAAGLEKSKTAKGEAEDGSRAQEMETDGVEQDTPGSQLPVSLPEGASDSSEAALGEEKSGSEACKRQRTGKD